MTRRTDDAVFVAGHHGMVGSAIVRRQQARGYTNIVTASRSEVDLTSQAQVRQFFADRHIDHVVLAAAGVGGIHANNTYPAELIYESLSIEANVIQEAHRAGVQHLLFLGSSCIYPRDAAQQAREDALLTGPLEATNEPYTIAKIAGIKLRESYKCQHRRDYRSVMPTNLCGPGDNFRPENSHVIPALLRRFHEAVQANAPEVMIWGSDTPVHEFLHVDDVAAASVYGLQLPGQQYRAHTQPMQVTGFTGRLEFDASKPDGTPRKLLDVSRPAQLGWAATISLAPGLEEAFRWHRASLGRA